MQTGVPGRTRCRRCGPLPRANCHVYRGNVSLLRGEKPIFGPVSKNNTGMATRRPAGNNNNNNNQNIDRKSRFSHTPLHSTPPLGEYVSDYYHTFWCEKTRMMWLRVDEKKFDVFSRFDKIPACDRRTDRRTSHGNKGSCLRSRWRQEQFAIQSVFDPLWHHWNNSLQVFEDISCVRIIQGQMHAIDLHVHLTQLSAVGKREILLSKLGVFPCLICLIRENRI